MQLYAAVVPALMLCLSCAGIAPTPPQSAMPANEPPPPQPASERPAPQEPPSSEPVAVPSPAQPEVASSFQFPIEGFAAGSTHGRRYLKPANHLGDDSTHEHLTRVVSIGNGIVRHVKRGGLQGYGSVVAVEHQLPDGELVVSIYGHLCSHEGHQISVDVGDVITKGTLLGYIGDDDENGHGPEHLHLGIRRGAYDGALCGYTGPRRCTPSRFYDPSGFIDARLTEP